MYVMNMSEAATWRSIVDLSVMGDEVGVSKPIYLYSVIWWRRIGGSDRIIVD